MQNKLKHPETTLKHPNLEIGYSLVQILSI